MTTTFPPTFASESGTKLSRITNNRQLQKFLSKCWLQKSLRIDSTPGLTIHQSGRWHLNLMAHGQRLSTTLGRYPDVTLAEARERALALRQDFLVNGKKASPRQNNRAEETITQRATPQSPTIDSLLPEYLHYRYEELLSSKSNKEPSKAIQVLEARYHKHLGHKIGNLHPSQLTNQGIIACLAPIASRKAERTKVLAIVSGLTKWFLLKGHVDANAFPIQMEVIRMALPKKLPPAEHHARLAPEDAPRLVALAWAPQPTVRDTLAALGLLLVLLSAQRVGNFLAFDSTPCVENRDWYSRWKDICFESRVWSIPAECRKVSQKGSALVAPLRIPITDEMSTIFHKIKKCWADLGLTLCEDDFVLPSYRNLSHPQKSSTVRRFLRLLHEKDVKATGKGFFDPEALSRIATPHGLRSTFEDWALAQGYPSKFVEKALDHSPPSQVEAAYQRSDFLEERRPMMEAWSRYCFSLVQKDK